MTGFDDITNFDHRGLWIDIQQDTTVNRVHSTSISPFQRELNSTLPHSVRKYKKYMKKKIETNQYEIKVSNLLDIANKRRLCDEEER